MSERWRIVGLSGILVLLILVLNLAYHNTRTTPVAAAVPDVPAATQQEALCALAAAGYQAVAQPGWAGAQAAWRSPGAYRLFFVAPSPQGSHDVYTAEVQVGDGGAVARLLRVTRLTDTPAGDETSPVLADEWLAFATRVAGRYQSVTCVRLSELRRQAVFAFTRPVEEVELSWLPQSPTLAVVAVQAGGRLELTIDPLAQRVEPDDGSLQYMPVRKGEMAWLPNLVSRVRELPGVGPEKIAFLENVFFTVVDWLTRLFHGQPRAGQAQATASPTPPPTDPATVASPATPAPTAAAIATATLTPTPEGRLLAHGVVWRGSVKPDPQRPYADVEVIDIDPSLLQIKMVPGTWEPRPTTGLVGSGVIPQQDWPALVAAFNGGFAAMHGQFGMMVDRKVYLPARDGVATLAVYDDGSIRIGTWGKDLTQTPDMVSYRQNCPPLIENGTITAETGKLALWGLSVANEVYLYRSGLGITRDGRLIYVCGKPLSAYTLARALQMAGAVYAMQLDVDEWHVAFITYDVQPGPEGSPPTVQGKKLLNNMHGFDGLFLRPFQLDFFYLTRRPERLERAVRTSPTPQPPASSVATVAEDLPGHLAFASNRDGNWELYAMVPGQPATLRRLTEHPADDLCPAWSPDGRRLAFASRRDGDAEVYVLDLETSAIQRVTHQTSEEWAPTWSPDGTRLAYQSDRNGQSDIYVAALDGSGETRLTPMEGNHEAPDWSPDGRLFVFDSDLDVYQAVHASINLYVMNADGTGHRRIFSSAESPRWSPDGRMVAFTTRRTGYWQVYVMNADGSGVRQVTSGAFDARYPAWSPDGRWLAYAANQEGHWELYVIPAGGGQPVRLTFGSSDNSSPSWGR